MEGAWKYSPAAAVPVRTKIPEPIIAPIPSAVSDQGPSVFFNRCSGSSELAMSLSMDFLAKSWLGRAGSGRGYEYGNPRFQRKLSVRSRKKGIGAIGRGQYRPR